MFTLIDLLTRVGACDDAATLYGAAVSASSGAPPYGADADLMRQTAAQVIDLALDAIARAAAKRTARVSGSPRE